jgi:hypothetical protein
MADEKEKGLRETISDLWTKSKNMGTGTASKAKKIKEDEAKRLKQQEIDAGIA